MVHKVYTPESPDPKAIKRVLHPVPVPTECTYCKGPVSYMHHERLYGMVYGDWPWALACAHCDARVGLHPGTGIPLGSMANAALRRARNKAKAALQPMFVGMDKGTAYRWLACQLSIPVEKCHIGMFTEDLCLKTVEVCCDYQTSRQALIESYDKNKYGPTTREFIKRRRAAGRRA